MPSPLSFVGVALSLATGVVAQAPAAVTHEGRVVDQLGEPVAAASIEAHSNGRVVARTVADGDGVYLLRLPAGGAEVRVAAPDKVTARLPWRGPATARVRNVVLEDGVTVRGRVTAAGGAAVAGANVVIVVGGASVSSTTGGDGAFVLHGVPMRSGVVRAMTETAWVEHSVRVGTDTRCDLELPAAARQPFLVEVEGATAEAIAGALVRVFGSDVTAVANAGCVPLRADGTATLPLAAPCLLELRVPGRATASRLTFLGRPSAQFRYADLALPPPATRVAGRVRNEKGEPAGNMRLFVRDRSRCDYATIPVDGDGRFDVRCAVPPDGVLRIGLPLGDWLLVGTDPAIADGCSWISIGKPKEPIELHVDRAGRIDAVVQTPDGVRLALADVVIADSSRPALPLLRTSADREGRLALGLPAGEHDLLAVTHDGKIVCATVDIVAGHLRAPQWKTVATGEITGVLRDAAGAPVAGVELIACSGDLQAGGGLHAGQRQRCNAVTDRLGRFRCRGLPAGAWTIAALHDDRVDPGATDVTAGSSVTVDLAYVR